MTDENNTPPQPVRTRRSSFAGETFANLFGTGSRSSPSRTSSESTSQNQQHHYAGPITSAAAQAQRRRLSLTTLGLSASPNQSSPFGSYHNRRDSYVSGTTSESIDESAIEDDNYASGPTPQTPFARRVSFGAKALRDVRAGGGNTPPGHNGGPTSAPSSDGSTSVANSNMQKSYNGTISARDVKGRGSSEGFNWSDNFRTRAERTSSIVGASSLPNGGNSGSPRGMHNRTRSATVMEPPTREMPKPREQGRPDHFQERILKGDFYMD